MKDLDVERKARKDKLKSLFETCEQSMNNMESKVM